MNKTQLNQITKSFLSALLFLAAGSAAFAQLGGSYTIAQSVIASGGGTSSGGNFSIESTTGQTLAGGLISTALFDIFSGFWTPAGVAPSLQFSSATYSVNENGGLATITVNRTGDATTAVSVNYATSALQRAMQRAAARELIIKPRREL